MRLHLALALVAFIAACGDGTGNRAAPTGTATAIPTLPPSLTEMPAPTFPPPPTKVADCRLQPDGTRCVHSCDNGVCERGFCNGECTPSATVTPSRTLTPSCARTLSIASCCAAHCRPCPTIRAGCNAQPCQDCIERPVCDPIPTCYPFVPTSTPTPTRTCPPPAPPVPDRTCNPAACNDAPYGSCVEFGYTGTCTIRTTSGQCYCYIESSTHTATPMPCSTPTPTPDECENQCSGPGERSCSSSKCENSSTAAGLCRSGDNGCRCGPFQCSYRNVRPNGIPETVDGLSVTVSGISDAVEEVEVRGGATTVFAEFMPNPPLVNQRFSAVPLQPGENSLTLIARRQTFPPPCYSKFGPFVVRAAP